MGGIAGLPVNLVLRAHRGGRALGLSAVTSVGILLLTGHVVQLPQVLQGTTQPVDVGLILALSLAPLTAYVFGGEPLRMEVLARRSLVPADGLLVLTLLLPVVVAGVVDAAVHAPSSGYELVRNCGAFSACTLALLAVTTTSVAAVVPVAYFVVMATAGHGSAGHVPWWAWLRAPAGPRDTVLALGLLAAAATVFHLHARRTAAARDVEP